MTEAFHALARRTGSGMKTVMKRALRPAGALRKLAGMITGRQISAAMALLDWTREETAKRAGVPATDVYHLDKRAIVEHALFKGGVAFLPDDGREGEGVRLRQPKV